MNADKIRGFDPRLSAVKWPLSQGSREGSVAAAGDGDANTAFKHRDGGSGARAC